MKLTIAILVALSAFSAFSATTAKPASTVTFKCEIDLTGGIGQPGQKLLKTVVFTEADSRTSMPAKALVAANGMTYEIMYVNPSLTNPGIAQAPAMNLVKLNSEGLVKLSINADRGFVMTDSEASESIGDAKDVSIACSASFR